MNKFCFHPTVNVTKADCSLLTAGTTENAAEALFNKVFANAPAFANQEEATKILSIELVPTLGDHFIFIANLSDRTNCLYGCGYSRGYLLGAENVVSRITKIEPG